LDDLTIYPLSLARIYCSLRPFKKYHTPPTHINAFLYKYNLHIAFYYFTIVEIILPLPLGEVGTRSVTGEGMKNKFAKKLRENATDVETILWYRLRNRQIEGFKFRRQQPIGKYIVDFVCIEKMLIIELDGGQHAEQIIYDDERTKYLSKLGYKVTRFWNNEVLTNLNGVLECIMEQLN